MKTGGSRRETYFTWLATHRGSRETWHSQLQICESARANFGQTPCRYQCPESFWFKVWIPANVPLPFLTNFIKYWHRQLQYINSRCSKNENFNSHESVCSSVIFFIVLAMEDWKENCAFNSDLFWSWCLIWNMQTRTLPDGNECLHSQANTHSDRFVSWKLLLTDSNDAIPRQHGWQNFPPCLWYSGGGGQRGGWTGSTTLRL